MSTRIPGVISLLILVSAFGCAKIPKNGAALSGQVSLGISRIQTENEKVIRTLADVERGVLDEKWDHIYEAVESKYFAKHGLKEDQILGQDHRRRIAANAAKVRQNLLEEISSVEAKLIKASRANADKVIEVNNVVQQYLLSLEKLDAARSKATKAIGEVTGIDLSDLRGLIDKRVKNIDSFADKILESGGA